MQVELIDHMGSDTRVVDAARVSFAKEASNYTEEQNDKLIAYLAKHNHWTPFSHVYITMRETVPIFVARQRFKHVVGFTYNEVSRRYVDDTPEFFVPDAWRRAPTDGAKQGSSKEVVEDWTVGWDYASHLRHCETLYETLLSRGVAPEQARMVLPQSMYTSYYVTGSLPAWARAYELRIDPHAQEEIADLAKMWYNTIYSIESLRNSWTTLTSSKDS